MADSDNTQTDNQLIEPPESAENETSTETDQPSAAQTTAQKRSSSSTLVFILLLLFATATAGGGFYLWQQQQALLSKQQSDNSNLLQRFQQLQNNANAVDNSVKTNTNRIAQLDNNQQLVAEISQQAIKVTSRAQRGWILAEIDYLLRMANRRLQVARDISGAIAALKGADQRLHELGDLGLFPIRKQLSEDIAELNALHQVDINGTALVLDGMITHLDKLPFKTIQDEIKTQFEKPEPEAIPAQDDNFVDSVINTVMNIGDIKIQHRSIEPASSAEQQQQIEQILRTHLLGARLAVLRYDQKQYAHDIEQSLNLLHLHYKENDNRVAQMKSDLTSFAAINLTPDLPVITKAWEMLRSTMQKPEVDSKKDATKKTTNTKSTATENAEVL